jgi:hypothetical protein
MSNFSQFPQVRGHVIIILPIIIIIITTIIIRLRCKFITLSKFYEIIQNDFLNKTPN